MKKLLLLLFLLFSCYREYETNPNRPEEYLGTWINKYTYVNDSIDYEDIVPHYSFGIMQSEVTLYESNRQVKEYQNWRVNKIDSILYLVNTSDSIFFKILKEPFVNKEEKYTKDMILKKDSVIYHLMK